MRHPFWIGIFFSFMALGLENCDLISPAPPIKDSPTTPQQVAEAQLPPSPKRSQRPPISVQKNHYEGSLWRDEASFGNLLRDHRARFSQDLLTIVDVNKVITVPAAKPKPEEQKPQNNVDKANVVLEALTLRDTIEEEQNDILRSVETLSAEVVKVLPNGNMIVRGRKVDHRQRNQIRYVTTLVGMLRPADVGDTNVVSATKLVNPEVQIKRQVQGSLLRERLDKLQPLIGKQQAGLLGRVTDFTKADAKAQPAPSKKAKK